MALSAIGTLRSLLADIRVLAASARPDPGNARLLALSEASEGSDRRGFSNAEGLILFSQILERIEQEPFASRRLREFVAELKGHGKPASRAIRKLASIVFWIDGSDSVLGRFLDLPLLYTIQTALAAEAWRKRWGARIGAWMTSSAKWKLCFRSPAIPSSIPTTRFPNLQRARIPRPLFEGEDLGHPLIPAAQCVRNSVRLGDRHARCS